jgi:hypothetical protein
MSAYIDVQILSGPSSHQVLPTRKPVVKARPASPPAIGSVSSERDRVRAALVAAGLSLPAPAAPVAGQLTLEEREKLAERIGAGTPLSQIIIEERRGR